MSHEEVKNKIKNYVEIDDRIIEIHKGLKTMRESKKMLGDEIQEFMKNNNLKELQSGNDKFLLKETVRSKMFSKKTLIDSLLGIMEKEKVNEITETLFKKDEEDKTIFLHRKK